MLPEQNRLRKDEDFARVRKNGRVFQSSSLALGVLRRADMDPTRFGIVISTKVSKRAVDRNALKRTLRAILSSLMSNVSAGYDCVVLTKKATLDLSRSQLEEDMDYLLRKAHLLN